MQYINKSEIKLRVHTCITSWQSRRNSWDISENRQQLLTLSAQILMAILNYICDQNNSQTTQDTSFKFTTSNYMQIASNSLIFQLLTHYRRVFIWLGNFGSFPWQAAMAGRRHQKKIHCTISAEQKLFWDIATESQDPYLSIDARFR